jgi:hypothetical protein
VTNRKLVELIAEPLDDELTVEDVAAIFENNQLLLMFYTEDRVEPGTVDVGAYHPKWVKGSFDNNPDNARAMAELLRMHADWIERNYVKPEVKH